MRPERPKILVDTNVFVGALISPHGANRKVIRSCLQGVVDPVMGQALYLEYEDVLTRRALFQNSPLSRAERYELFDAFLSACTWIQIYYGWRPNLHDEADNHVMELAVAASASAIVTNNLSHFRGAELRFPQIAIIGPSGFIKEWL